MNSSSDLAFISRYSYSNLYFFSSEFTMSGAGGSMDKNLYTREKRKSNVKLVIKITHDSIKLITGVHIFQIYGFFFLNVVF